MENLEILNINRMMEALHLQKLALKTQLETGIITIVDAVNETDMITKKERKLKEQLIKSVHVTENGVMRSIHHHLPTSGNPKDYYITKLDNGRKIKGASYESLLNKLYAHYSDGLTNFSVGMIFKAAIQEKEMTENPSPNTIRKDKADFARFISDDFARKDIRYITDIDIKKYCQAWVTKEHPKKKAFLSFKGTLNLIFNYAKRHRIIDVNPLESVSNKPYIKSCDTAKAKPEDKILSPEEIEALVTEVRRRMTTIKYGRYYINGYAMLFAIETGVRIGELCALKWEDIKEDRIHIHSQQLNDKQPGGRVYYLVPYTKNEKGESEDGRDFPLTLKIKSILDELKALQEELDIHSEFIFCHEDGEWIKTDAYVTFLKRLCSSLGLKVTNNHALRMSLNSNVLIPLGISVADRAAMLGHSIETNLKFYSFAQKGYLGTVKDLLDNNSARLPEGPSPVCEKSAVLSGFCEESDDREPQGTLGNPSKVINFAQKKSSRSTKSQAF